MWRGSAKEEALLPNPAWWMFPYQILSGSERIAACVWVTVQMLYCCIVFQRRPVRRRMLSTGKEVLGSCALTTSVSADRGVQPSGRPLERKFCPMLGAITCWIERLSGSLKDLMSMSSVSKFRADKASVGLKSNCNNPCEATSPEGKLTWSTI